MMTKWLTADIRAVFFDAVGTLLFPQPSAPRVYVEVARRRGLDLSEAEVRSRFLAAYQREEEADRRSGWRTSEDRERQRWRAIVRTTLDGVDDPDACFAELFEHFARPEAWRLYPDAAVVIGRIAATGRVVGLGSNHDARLHRVLDGFPELAPLRSHAVISAAVGFRKPAGEFFLELVRRAGCEPRQILFVGDDPANDHLGSRAAGLRGVLLDSEGRYGEADQRIARLADLLVSGES